MSDRLMLLQQIRATALHRKQAESKAETHRARGDELIIQGYKAGLPKQQLADAAGLTRQTVYTVLRKAGVEA